MNGMQLQELEVKKISIVINLQLKPFPVKYITMTSFIQQTLAFNSLNLQAATDSTSSDKLSDTIKTGTNYKVSQKCRKSQAVYCF